MRQNRLAESKINALRLAKERSSGYSPDRADALVWAIADLLGLDRKDRSGMVDFYREAAGKG